MNSRGPKQPNEATVVVGQEACTMGLQASRLSSLPVQLNWLVNTGPVPGP